MTHALAVKGQVAIPKAMIDHMNAVRGQELEFVAQPNGQMLMFPAKKAAGAENPFLKWRGKGILKMATEDILRETRGDDCMR